MVGCVCVLLDAQKANVPIADHASTTKKVTYLTFFGCHHYLFVPISFKVI